MIKHLPTLKTCQQLRDAGFPQEVAYGGWYYGVGRGRSRAGDIEHALDEIPTLNPRREWKDVHFYCRAPILTEILEQLPRDGTVRVKLEIQSLLWLELNKSGRR